MIWNLIARFLAIPLIARALIWSARYSPYEHIYSDIAQRDLYMLRFWIIKERPRLPFAARIHGIIRPDGERDKHDHPAPFRTIILTNGYSEIDIYDKRHMRLAGDTVKHSAEYFHRIDSLIDDRPTYTLFVYNNWAPRNHWGFLRGDMFGVVKVPWKKYLDTKHAHQLALRNHEERQRRVTEYGDSSL